MKNITLNLLLICTFVLLSTSAFSQKVKWLKKKYREDNFKKELYLTGYSYDEKKDGESIADAVGRVKAMAKGQIAQNLISEIQTDHTMQTVETDESISQSFEMNITSEAKAEIYGMTVEGYYDKGDKMVYGFAYTKRDDVVQYYKTNIDKNMQAINSIIGTAEELVTNGDYDNAESEYKKTHSYFVKIKYASDFIVLIKAAPLDLKYTEAIRQLEYSVEKELGNVKKLKNEMLFVLEYNYKTYHVLPEDLNGTYTWEQAINTCKNLVAFDMDDWVLPAKNVLSEIYTRKREIKQFKSNGAYWSSTDNEGNAWGRQFSDSGASGYGNKEGYARVRCVREKVD